MMMKVFVLFSFTNVSLQYNMSLIYSTQEE